MTNTNRAFIKAYRHDAAQATGESSPLAILAERRVATATVAAAAGVPAESATGADVSQGSTVNVSPSIHLPHSTSPKRPLSSYMAKSRDSRPIATEEHSTFFRPGTTVASFHWPAVCRVLTQQYADQLDSVADLIVTNSLSGRSLIGVMGLFAKRGATTLALCLATRIAQRGRRLILVDGNFVNPRLATWLDVVPTAGWEEALKHVAQLSDAAIHATDDRLDILALGAKKAKDPQHLVSGLQAAVTAGVLRHAYDIVLIDVGPFFDVVSQPIVLELVRNLGIDAVVAVSGPEPTDSRDMGTVTEYLGRSSCELLGAIENRLAGQSTHAHQPVDDRQIARSSNVNH